MNLPHEWVGAGLLLLTRKHAEQATRSGKVTIVSRITVDVLDVYCRKCRRAYAVAKDEQCMLGSQHIGGPRKQPDPLTLDLYPDDDSWPPPHDPLA